METDSMLAKGLRVLRHLMQHPHGQGVSTIARAQNLPVSTTHRMLSTLVATNWVTRSPSATYRLGPQMFLAVEAMHASSGLSDMHSILTDLADSVGETVILGTLIGQEFIYLDVIHGPGLLGIKGSVGQRGPLHCTAIGKSLLTALPSPQREELIQTLELRSFTANTITDSADLSAEIDRSVRRGYTEANEENEVGVTSVGIPVPIQHDPDGRYAMCVSAPTQRAGADRRRDFLAALTRCRDVLRTAGVSPR
ncbi:IclR family transcriptional regulator [Pseudactinotalea sp. Z1748]|uniref:IclR family transcriptional regulator n=1 Tax=Pseudactinotalea sp. Z1748 TaxID=3413027 RepID=UPI003C7DB589